MYINKAHVIMGICFCCLDEGDKVGLVLKKFPALPASQAQDNVLQKLVGRVVLAGNAPFYAPANNMPCVYWHITVSEERIRHVEHVDQHGNRSHRVENYWQEIVNQEAFADFYLQDGISKVFVNGSNRGQVKVQSISTVGDTTYFQQPPPGVQWLISQSNSNFSWYHDPQRTGRFSYSQVSFDVNELVAALGVVAPAVDPFSGQPCKFLTPIRGDVLNEAYFEANKWDDWDRRSWQDLVAQCPSVLASDNPEFTMGVTVAPVGQLPTFMTYNAQVAFQPPPPPQYYPPGPK